MNWQHRRILAFAALFAWCALLLAARVLRSGSFAYLFLAWNLFLAAIPPLAAVMLARATRQRRSTVAQAIWIVVWLTFLPNAPYIATDFLHLRARAPVPLWYDVALLLSFAITGLLLGYCSIADVQREAARRFGAATSWLTATGALLLSGFGIYIGRFLRWNSWDLLLTPHGVLGDIAARVLDPFAHPKTLAVSAVYGIGLLVGYIAFQLLFAEARAATELRNSR